MKLTQFQVDAFADQIFKGNPAAVCPLERWPDDDLMQSIAEENNLSETAFFVPIEGGFKLRWFTPVTEVDLCGHATLAAAHVIFNELGYDKDRLSFETRSGVLTVSRRNELLSMDFPIQRPVKCATPEHLTEALGTEPVEVYCAADYLAVFKDEETVAKIVPDQLILKKLGLRGVIISAPGRSVDFVSRFFAPKCGIPEDPVTGSAHCVLAPYWADKLGKIELKARQISKRGGELNCILSHDRVIIEGRAVTFLKGEIKV